MHLLHKEAQTEHCLLHVDTLKKGWHCTLKSQLGNTMNKIDKYTLTLEY